MAQAITALVSLALVAIALRTIAGSLIDELPALRLLVGQHSSGQRVARFRVRALPARPAAMLQAAAAPRRATA